MRARGHHLSGGVDGPESAGIRIFARPRGAPGTFDPIRHLARAGR